MSQADSKMALRVERLSSEEEIEFRINSSIEVRFILRDIANQGEPVALFYNDDQDSLLTRLLEVDEDDEGIWVDSSGSPETNRQILASDKLTFVSMHQNIKIQFQVSEIGSYPYAGGEAFFIDMPDYILRILRREFVRIPIPAETSVTCVIPTRIGSGLFMREFPVAEISGDGIGLICEKNEEFLVPGSVFKDCEILIPNFGTLKATIRVRVSITFTAQDNVVRRRVGCQLLFLNNRMSVLLQRYVMHLQGEMKWKPVFLKPPPKAESEEDEAPE